LLTANYVANYIRPKNLKMYFKQNYPNGMFNVYTTIKYVGNYKNNKCYILQLDYIVFIYLFIYCCCD